MGMASQVTSAPGFSLPAYEFAQVWAWRIFCDAFLRLQLFQHPEAAQLKKMPVVSYFVDMAKAVTIATAAASTLVPLLMAML